MRAAPIFALLVVAAAGGEAIAQVSAPGVTPRADAAAPAPPAERPTWMFSFGFLIRQTSRDPEAAEEIGALEAYGWIAEATPLFGMRGDVAYLNAPLVDLGLAWAWGRADFAAGPAFEDPDRIRGSSLEMGAFARLHWVKPGSPVAAEPRAEIGLARTTTEVRGVAEHEVSRYTRVGLDFRLGGRLFGALLSVDYTRVADGDAMLSVPSGGISYGLAFYLRAWP